MTEEIKKLIESVKVYQHPVPLCFDSIARALVDKSDFDKVVKELEYLSELRKPSEDIKQAIEEASKEHADIYCDPTDEVIYVTKYLIFSWVKESFIAGAEFALRLSENSGQVDEDLVKKITDILLKNHHGAGFTIPDFEVTAFKIAALIPSSPSGENGTELLEAAKQILDLHVCEMEGLSSGQPTPTEWMNAVDKLSEAISNYEKQSK